MEKDRAIISFTGQQGVNIRNLEDTTCSVIGCFETRSSKCMSCLYCFCDMHTAMRHDGHKELQLRDSHRPATSSSAQGLLRAPAAKVLCSCGIEILPASMKSHVKSADHKRRVESSSQQPLLQSSLPSVSNKSLDAMLATALSVTMQQFEAALSNFKDIISQGEADQQTIIDMVAAVYNHDVVVLGGPDKNDTLIKTSEARSVHGSGGGTIQLLQNASGEYSIAAIADVRPPSIVPPVVDSAPSGGGGSSSSRKKPRGSSTSAAVQPVASASAVGSVAVVDSAPNGGGGRSSSSSRKKPRESSTSAAVPPVASASAVGSVAVVDSAAGGGIGSTSSNQRVRNGPAVNGSDKNSYARAHQRLQHATQLLGETGAIISSVIPRLNQILERAMTCHHSTVNVPDLLFRELCAWNGKKKEIVQLGQVCGCALPSSGISKLHEFEQYCSTYAQFLLM